MSPVGQLPPGQPIELRGRGSTYVVDSGPATGGPTFVMLHSLACTGMLTWYPSLEMMRQFGRVVVFDQRWHGRGIASSRFLLEDCADDVAALADELGVEQVIPVGFSMGSLIAQLVWQRHRDRVAGLVLSAAASTFADATPMRLGTGLFAALLEAFSPQPRPAAGPVEADGSAPSDVRWLLNQFRSTSHGAILRVLAEVTRFDSRRWVADIDVPTTVLVTGKDRVISPRQQHWLADQIPGADTVTIKAGHASCTLQAQSFVPGLREAVDSVVQRAAVPRLGAKPGVAAS